VGHTGLVKRLCPFVKLLFEGIHIVLLDMPPTGAVVNDIIDQIAIKSVERLIISGDIISCHDTFLIKIDVLQADMNTSRIFGDTPPMVRDVSPMVRDVSPMARDMSPIARDVSPIARDVSPMVRDVSPIARDVSLIARDVSLMVREASPKARIVFPITGSAIRKARLADRALRITNRVVQSASSPLALWQQARLRLMAHAYCTTRAQCKSYGFAISNRKILTRSTFNLTTCSYFIFQS
jgi:hypothetical protein